MRECRFCSTVHDDDKTCPSCEKQHQAITEKAGRLYWTHGHGYGDALCTPGRKVPPKYGWGG